MFMARLKLSHSDGGVTVKGSGWILYKVLVASDSHVLLLPGKHVQQIFS